MFLATVLGLIFWGVIGGETRSVFFYHQFLLCGGAMQTSYPIHVVNRAVQSVTSWDSYTAKDWVFIALAVIVLLAYEGFYLAVYHLAPHRCTLHRNILCRRYVGPFILCDSELID